MFNNKNNKHNNMLNNIIPLRASRSSIIRLIYIYIERERDMCIYVLFYIYYPQFYYSTAILSAECIRIIEQAECIDIIDPLTECVSDK